MKKTHKKTIEKGHKIAKAIIKSGGAVKKSVCCRYGSGEKGSREKKAKAEEISGRNNRYYRDAYLPSKDIR